MEFAIRMTVFIAVIVAFSFIWYGCHLLYTKRNLAKFDKYDRVLNSLELSFLKQAETDLEAAATVRTPKWYSLFLYTAFVPTMCLCGVLIGGFLFGIHYLIDAPDVQPEGVIFQTGGEIFGAFFVSIFGGGIFLAAVMLYAVSLRKQSLSNFVALNSNAYGFNKKSVMDGLLANLEHKIRSRQQSTSVKFSADKFLNQINIFYRNMCLKCFYGCMVAAAILAVFDLRSGVTFYDTKMVGAGSYFTVSPKQTIPYERVSKVELDCYFYEGDPTSKYTLFVEGEEFISMFLSQDRLGPLSELNAVLRNQSHIIFEPRVDKNGKVWMSSKCVSVLGEEWGEPELLRSILSTET